MGAELCCGVTTTTSILMSLYISLLNQVWVEEEVITKNLCKTLKSQDYMVGATGNRQMCSDSCIIQDSSQIYTFEDYNWSHIIKCEM